MHQLQGLVGWLSGGFTPCRHLRPSSGREHIQSGDDDYLMNETRRKPTTGRQSPTLFDKWHGIFYMPSRIDEAAHTKAFDDPVAEHWGESQRAKRSLVGLEPTSAHTYESEIQRSTTYATPTRESGEIYHGSASQNNNKVKLRLFLFLEWGNPCFATPYSKL